MGKFQHRSANRSFGFGHGTQKPKEPEQHQEQKVKDILFSAAEIRRAKKELDYLLLLFHGKKSILQLLPAIKQRCSRAALSLAIKRVEGKKDGLSVEDQIFFEQFKSSLNKKE